MKSTQVLNAFRKAGKCVHLVGDLRAGVIVALDLEGRLFTVLDGDVLNRVNLDAIAGESTQKQYLNPGGDGLWPAPEGTSLGYQYSAGAWRVTPGLRAARYLVIKATKRSAEIVAEVDLINAQGRGIPTLFKRQITVTPGRRSVTVRVVESITYIGRTPLRRTDCLLAPWTLCQFDSGPGCEVKRTSGICTTTPAMPNANGAAGCAALRPTVCCATRSPLESKCRGLNSETHGSVWLCAAKPVRYPQANRILIFAMRHPMWRRAGRVFVTVFTATRPTSWKSKRSVAARQ
jgi:hypothetical protein